MGPLCFKMNGDNGLFLELLPLRAENILQPRPQNRILVPLRGSDEHTVLLLWEYPTGFGRLISEKKYVGQKFRTLLSHS